MEMIRALDDQLSDIERDRLKELSKEIRRNESKT